MRKNIQNACHFHNKFEYNSYTEYLTAQTSVTVLVIKKK